MVVLNSLGGWGLKNIHLFGYSLVTGSLWNMISKESLRKIILVEKYIAPYSILDWIRKERKSTQNISNQWRALTLTFPLIGSFFSLEGCLKDSGKSGC